MGQGSNGGYDISNDDGANIFTEDIRSRVYRVLERQSTDPKLGNTLLRLATQEPNPSHQAKYFLTQLLDQGLAATGYNYDELIHAAWNVDSKGFPHLAKQALADIGVRYEFEGDGK